MTISLKRIALWFLIVSVGTSALLGIIIVLAGSFSDPQLKIILTTLTISATSICALACGALREGRAKVLLPLVGAILALLSAALLIFGIWTEAERDQFWKFTISVSLLAVATAHVCLLALARLARRFLWTRIATFLAVYFLAGLFIYIIYFHPEGNIRVRIIGATAIVVAALSILTPIFHRLSRDDIGRAQTEPARTETDMHATLTCPQCGFAVPSSLNEIKCDHCGCRFLVTIVAPRAEGV